MNRLAAAVLLAGAITATWPASASAQTANNQIAYGAIMKAPVGSWAEYLMTKEEEHQTVRVRYALVERSAKRIAVELDSATPMGHMLMRLEFAPDDANKTRWKLRKARTKMADAPARDVEIPPSADPQGTSFGKDDQFGEPLGKETIKVKAGTFTADHFRRKVEGWATEVWIDEKVLPVGLVRLADTHGSSVELVATGAGAKSGF